MKNRKLTLLAVSAVALAATQAHAQSTVGNLADDGFDLVANGGNTCADGETTGGYTTTNGSTNLGNVTVSDPLVAQTLCGTFDATEYYSTFTDTNITPFGDDGYLFEVGEAVSTAEYSVEQTYVYDTSELPAVLVDYDEDAAPISDSEVQSYYLFEAEGTDQYSLVAFEGYYEGDEANGTGSQSLGIVTPEVTVRYETSGTSSFDPTTGNVIYTATSGVESFSNAYGTGHYSFNPDGDQSAWHSADGFFYNNSGEDYAYVGVLGEDGSVGIATSGTGYFGGGVDTPSVINSAGSLYLAGNGPSYIQINDDNVTIHGGTSSTTAVWDNSGYTQTDSTNGVTFTVDNFGNMQNIGNSTVGGNLQVNGNATVNGFTTLNGGAQINNGLTVNGGSTLNGGTTMNGGATVNGLLTANNGIVVNGGATIAGGMTVSGNSTFNNNVTVLGTTTTNGIVNTGNITNSGNITTGSLNVTGATTTNGITNTGDIATTTLTTTGNATVGGALAVAGATTTNGISNTGTITSTGNITSSGTVTGATLVSAGATSVGTNLTVGGTASIAGNTSLGGNLAVVGNYSTASGNIVTGTGQIWAGNVRINPGNNGTISGLTNATLSATSTEAVTGQQLFATNNALSALDARERANFNLLMNRADKAYQGVAMAFAMNAAPLNLDDGQGGISGGVGAFEGAWAGAIRAQYVTKSGVGIGANIGFAKDSVGGAVGASIKF